MANLNFLVPDDVIKILVSLLLGSLIGLEREYNSKSAGFRTIILISVGSTLFTILSKAMGAPNDITRIAANIVTGIGFLGAGVIFRDDNRVRGVTTAATIWVTAALGMCIGSGHILFAFYVMMVVIAVLWGLTAFQGYVDRKHQVRKYRIACNYSAKKIEKIVQLFKDYNLHAVIEKQTREENLFTGVWLAQGSEKHHDSLTEILINDPSIKEFEY